MLLVSAENEEFLSSLWTDCVGVPSLLQADALRFSLTLNIESSVPCVTLHLTDYIIITDH